MNARAANGLAWSLCLVTLALLGLGLILWVANGLPLLLGTDQATGGPGIRFLSVLTFALIAVVALLIATRQRRNPIGWILLIGVAVSSLDLSTAFVGLAGSAVAGNRSRRAASRTSGASARRVAASTC